MCCYNDWLLNSENGKILLQKHNIKSGLKANSTELKKELINTRIIVHNKVKERDRGLPCISCGTKWNKNFEAGHFFAAGSYETLRFHFDNIHGQCYECNNGLEGNFKEYMKRLPGRIGEEKFKNLIQLSEIDKQAVKVWNVEKLKQIQIEANQI